MLLLHIFIKYSFHYTSLQAETSPYKHFLHHLQFILLELEYTYIVYSVEWNE